MYNDYIEYFEKLGIVIIPDNKNIVITINLDRNFVSMNNEYSNTHVCVSIEPKIPEHPIALRIYNDGNWKIHHTSTHTVIVVDRSEASLFIKDRYTIAIH